MRAERNPNDRADRALKVVGVFAALFLLLVLIKRNTYGPIIEETRIRSVRWRDPHRFAAALERNRFRLPIGLFTFPDGGTRLNLGDRAFFYIGDTDSDVVRLVARMDKPKSIYSGFEPGIEGWDSTGFVAAITGNRFDRSEVILHYHVTPPGEIRELSKVSRGALLPNPSHQQATCVSGFTRAGAGNINVNRRIGGWSRRPARPTREPRALTAAPAVRTLPGCASLALP